MQVSNRNHQSKFSSKEWPQRPEECFRLRWENVRDESLHVPFGNTVRTRRTIPLTPRAIALIEMRRPRADHVPRSEVGPERRNSP